MGNANWRRQKTPEGQLPFYRDWHAWAYVGSQHQGRQAARFVKSQILCAGRMRPNAQSYRHAARCASDFHGDTSRQASDDVLRHPLQGDTPRLQKVYARPDGDIRGRREEADPPRSAAVLHRARRGPEEPKTERPLGRPGVQPGDHFRQQSLPGDGAQRLAGRAGRFGTKGLSVSFIATDDDKDILSQVQKRFEVDVPVLPDEMDVSTYMTT